MIGEAYRELGDFDNEIKARLAVLAVYDELPAKLVSSTSRESAQKALRKAQESAKTAPAP